jgi:hypothetical protein
LTQVLWEALDLVDDTGLVVSKYIVGFNTFTGSEFGVVETITQLRENFELPVIQDLGVTISSGFFA